MPTFVLLTRLSPEAVRTPAMLFGSYDYLDIFHAPDVETAAKVATLIRIHGRAQTETWAAVEWDRFKTLVRELGEEHPHVLVES